MCSFWRNVVNAGVSSVGKKQIFENPHLPKSVGRLVTPVGEVSLRAVRLRDAKIWSKLRIENREFLRPWEPTCNGSWEQRHSATNWPGLYRIVRHQARNGALVPLVIEVTTPEAVRHYVGQLTIGNIQRGALQSAWVGYWVDQRWSGNGIATTAVALAVDYAFGVLGLHRLEATVQQNNVGSVHVLQNSGFRKEGVLQRYMDVDGLWRDHEIMGLTREEIETTVTDKLIRAGKASVSYR